MVYAGDAPGRWSQEDGKRRGFISRCEKYATFTIPKVCTPQGYNQNSTELQHDFQAVGAQAVNNLLNKIMLALFAPSRPFFRLDADTVLQKELDAAGVTPDVITDMLAKGEKAAIAQLDRMSMRPKLYEAIKHLIVTGNCLLILDKKAPRVIGIKHYVVRRSMSGQILEILHRDEMMFDELDPDVQAQAMRYSGYSGNTSMSEHKVTLYRWIKRNATGDYEMTQWVDQYQLPKKFNGRWPEAQLPYRVLTWDLSDDAHYGTGLVEDYQGDFAGLSMLSKAQIMGAVLASEFRWLADPAGMTRVEDFRDSLNGAVLPGRKDDVSIVQSNKSADLQTTQVIGAEYIKRIGSGFLMGSAITRDAERVTAEEIRMQANELESSLGGVYSRLAGDIQLPMAYWLMDIVGLNIAGQHVQPSIVTGLDALSRSGDLDELKQWLEDMALVNSLPPALQQTLNMGAIAAALAAPRRVDYKQFMLSPEQQQANAQAQASTQVQADAAQTGVETAGKVAVQTAKQQPQGA